MCEGEGQVTVSMQFMADVHLPCEACGGSRYKQEALEVYYRGKNISDLLKMDIYIQCNAYKKCALETFITEATHNQLLIFNSK